MQCVRCKADKGVSDFYPSLLNRKYRICKKCWGSDGAARVKRMRAEQPERYRAMWRKDNLRKKYGISISEYEALLAGQGGRCAICGSDHPKATLRGKPASWHVDHDHVTGNVRGLLCAKCNLGLGSFEDSPESLRAAALYIEAANKRAVRAA